MQLSKRRIRNVFVIAIVSVMALIVCSYFYLKHQFTVPVEPFMQTVRAEWDPDVYETRGGNRVVYDRVRADGEVEDALARVETLIMRFGLDASRVELQESDEKSLRGYFPIFLIGALVLSVVNR